MAKILKKINQKKEKSTGIRADDVFQAPKTAKHFAPKQAYHQNVKLQYWMNRIKSLILLFQK